MTTNLVATYRDLVPNQPRTPSRSMRAADPEWEGLDVTSKHQGIDRTKWLKWAMDWNFHKPGTDTPPRLSLAEMLALMTEAAESAPAGTQEEIRRKIALQAMAAELADRAKQQPDA